MEFELQEIEQEILKLFNNEGINYSHIIACKDKGLLQNYIELINNITKNYSIKFKLEKFLTNEYLLLKSPNNLKLIITNFYINIIIEE